MRLLLLLTISFLIVTGCSFIPEYKRSALPVSNEYETTDITIFDNRSEAALLPYKEFFRILILLIYLKLL